LLSSSLEVVICSYRENQIKFPWILQKFDITAFDFYTIIECVIKNEPKFPHTVRNHLIRIEERILEEMAWEHNSPIFTGLNSEQRQLLREQLEKKCGNTEKNSQKCL